MILSTQDKLSEAKLRFYTLVNGYLAIGLATGLIYVVYTIGKVLF